MGGIGTVDQQLVGFPRSEAVVLEVGEDPRVVGISDRIDRRDASGAMVDVVKSPRHFEFPVRDHDGIGFELADLLGDCMAQFEVRLEQSISEIEDLKVVNADDCACLTLFVCSQRSDFLGAHFTDARFTTSQQQIGHGLALVCPFGYRRGGAVFHVIGMGDDAQEAIDLIVVEDRKFSHSPRLSLARHLCQSNLRMRSVLCEWLCRRSVTQPFESGPMYRSFLLASVMVLGLSLSGCSALRVSTAEGDSRPASVGINDGSEEETPQGSDTPAIPAGMAEVAVDLGPECPIKVQLAMDGQWNGDLSYDSYQLYTRDDGAIITVNCNEAEGETAQSIIDTAQEQTFGESRSSILEEKTGTVTGGKYWTVHGELARQEIRAIDETESLLFGAIAGISDNGRLYKVSVEMVTVARDQATADLFAQMLPTVRFADQVLDSPALS